MLATPHLTSYVRARLSLQEGLKILAAKGSKIGVCATSMDGRGLKAEALAEGAYRSTLDELAAWTQDADRVIEEGRLEHLGGLTQSPRCFNPITNENQAQFLKLKG